MFHYRSIFKYTKIESYGLSARRYLKSISQSALHYRPLKIRQLNENQSFKDRVVQQFFDSYSLAHRIKVFQADQRLNQCNKISTPSHSFYQVTLPFKQNQFLRLRMVQFFTKYVRVGRILQLMDYIAANVAYRYCIPNILPSQHLSQLPFFIVTAAIDQIDFFHPITTDTNCSFSGHVSFVGTSSMQIQISVTQIINDKERLSCSANFVMVARDRETKKAYRVPGIDLVNQPEYLRIKNQLGFQRQKLRKEEAEKSLNISPPTYEQSSQVHKLLLQLNTEKNKDKTSNFMNMGQTVLKSTQLMHLQDKNLSGKIFGGFIMRLGYQLAWLTAYQFTRGNFPICTHIDDVQFLTPVEIGSILSLESVVSYVSDESLMHVIVTVKNIQPSGSTHMTNILRVNFQPNTSELRRVYPITLAQSFQYIESMRRVKKYLAS